MIFVDTSYLVALVRPRDELHQRTLAWGQILTETLLSTEYVLWETVNQLSSPIERPKAHALLVRFRVRASAEIIPATAELFEAGLKLHAERPDKEWSLTDCISFLVMEERGMTRALTHDHHFEQAGFEALLRRDPTA